MPATMTAMTVLDKVTSRIAELKQQREEFQLQANMQMASFNAAISENERLLNELTTTVDQPATEE